MSGDIAQRVLEGDRRALTRILTWVENGYPEARDALRSLFPHTGRAHIVGVTGPTGAGQDEVEIADTAHTTVVINIPGAGDDMQAIKAGILEIADILVVNKADLAAAESVFKQLHIFMALDRNEGWQVPILKTVSHKGQGIIELLQAIDDHRAYLEKSGRLDQMRRQRARRQLLAAAQ